MLADSRGSTIIPFPGCDVPAGSGLYEVTVESKVCVAIVNGHRGPLLAALTAEDIGLTVMPSSPGFGANEVMVDPVTVPGEVLDEMTGLCTPWPECPVDRMHGHPLHTSDHGHYHCPHPRPPGGCERSYYWQRPPSHYQNPLGPGATVACREEEGGMWCCHQWWRVTMQPPPDFIAPHAPIDLHIQFPLAPMGGCSVGQLPDLEERESKCMHVIRLTPGEV